MPRSIWSTQPLTALLADIVQGEGTESLTELLAQRSVFTIGDERHLLFVEFVRRLADDARRRGWGRYADSAATAVTDRFSRIPSDSRGVDCRKTYRIALDLLGSTTADELQAESDLSRVLTALARKCFERALREARRSDDRTRFVWQVQGAQLRLLMPRTLAGDERPQWLQRNIPDVVATRAGERERVQAIIDARLGVSMASVDDERVGQIAASAVHASHALDKIESSTLGECVAEEKAAAVAELRPSIRKLGPRMVRSLVVEIFQRIDAGDYHESEIAAKFGIDAASFSRFAGGRWKASGRVPDLWRNLAKLLASHERFRHLCEDAGVWRRVQGIVTPPAPV